jgi:hypothetical protein
MNAFSFSIGSAHRHCEEPRGSVVNGRPDDKLRDKAIQKLLESKLKKRWAKAVDRNGYLFSEQITVSRAPSAPHRGFALDIVICSEATVAVAIDGAKRSP